VRREQGQHAATIGSQRVDLLINFGDPTLREGLRRIVNGFPSSAPSRLRVNQVVVDRAIRQRY
jgi:hypothetical protein